LQELMKVIAFLLGCFELSGQIKRRTACIILGIQLDLLRPEFGNLRLQIVISG
jgi:hypothetical protein